MKNKNSGFTLIELIIVVLIVGILAAVSFPAYKDYIRQARRTEAQGVLEGLAQAMQRHFTQNTTYASAITGSAPKPPNIYPTQAPLDGATKYYNLRVTAVTATTFTVQAQPIAGGDQATNGLLQLNHLDQRVWDRDNDGNLAESSDSCWRKEC